MTFGSDNQAGAHPDVLAAISRANEGRAASYGDDAWTARAAELLRAEFGADAQVFPVTTGTAANVLCVEAACRPQDAVLCSSEAHLLVDECGAPQRYTGASLHAVVAPAGKLTPAALAPLLADTGDVHRARPRLVSLTQSTEYGTVYRPEEIRAIAAFARENGLFLHLDGARLANAAASIGTSIGALAAEADLISFGATKCGALLAEAVILRNPLLAEGFARRRKQAMQLVSKQRFLAAQFVALLEDGLALRLAAHANAMAQRLGGALAAAGLVPLHPVEANAVFVHLPGPVVAALGPRFGFGWWKADRGEVRLMCAWDTTPAEVDALAAAITELARR